MQAGSSAVTEVPPGCVHAQGRPAVAGAAAVPPAAAAPFAHRQAPPVVASAHLLRTCRSPWRLALMQVKGETMLFSACKDNLAAYKVGPRGEGEGERGGWDGGQLVLGVPAALPCSLVPAHACLGCPQPLAPNPACSAAPLAPPSRTRWRMGSRSTASRCTPAPARPASRRWTAAAASCARPSAAWITATWMWGCATQNRAQVHIFLIAFLLF